MSIFITDIRPGVLASVFMIILYISNMGKIFFAKNIAVATVLLYLFYSTLTIVMYAYNGLPLTVYFSEFANSILPMGFFFIAYCSKKETKILFWS